MMENQVESNGMFNEVISILAIIKERITDDSDLTWTSYNTPSELRNSIDGLLRKLKQHDIKVLKDINLHFLPTCTFQEHAMANGWSEEYLVLAERYDKLYEVMMKGSI